MSQQFLNEDAVNIHSFHLAGIVPVNGQPLDFQMPWHDCLQPISQNFLAVEIHLSSSSNIIIAHVSNKNFPHGYIRTALGAFYNHSDDPNCIVLNGYWHQIPVKYLSTSCDIKAGDELTAKYTLYTVEDFSWE